MYFPYMCSVTSVNNAKNSLRMLTTKKYWDDLLELNDEVKTSLGGGLTLFGSLSG